MQVVHVMSKKGPCFVSSVPLIGDEEWGAVAVAFPRLSNSAGQEKNNTETHRKRNKWKQLKIFRSVSLKYPTIFDPKCQYKCIFGLCHLFAQVKSSKQDEHLEVHISSKYQARASQCVTHAVCFPLRMLVGCLVQNGLLGLSCPYGCTLSVFPEGKEEEAPPWLRIASNHSVGPALRLHPSLSAAYVSWKRRNPLFWLLSLSLKCAVASRCPDLAPVKGRRSWETVTLVALSSATLLKVVWNSQTLGFAAPRNHVTSLLPPWFFFRDGTAEQTRAVEGIWRPQTKAAPEVFASHWNSFAPLSS